MSVSRPCYVTREAVQRAADIKFTARMADAVDRALVASAESIDGFMARRFYNVVETVAFDWPNYQYASPQSIWLDRKELSGQPTLVTTGSLNPAPVTIPSSDYLLWPYTGPPFTRLDLRNDKNSAFGSNPTPQKDIAVTGPFGYWQRTKAGGTLTAGINASVTAVSVSDSSLVGVGDVITVGSESMLVADKKMVSTGVTWAGLAAASAQDNEIQVPDGTLFSIGETLLADTERVWVADILGNTLVVKRAWDGTMLDQHTGGTLYAARQLSVTRGDFGTTAATHNSSDAVSVALVPGLIRDLALAESVVQVLNETGGYSGHQSGEGGTPGPDFGGSLADKWEEAETRYARKVRIRGV